MAEVVLAENRGPGIQEMRPRKRAKVDHVRLRVKKLADHAVLPRRATPGAAGYDLSSAQDLVIPAQASGLVKTGLALAIPHGTYGRVAPRSGLALRHSIAVGAGVIDEDYRGELRVILFNHGEKHFEVKRGDRIAQLILERICTPEVEEVSELDTTERGAGGFGSTGVPLSEKSLNDEATQQ